jgi:hypothetical protein
MFPYMTNTQIFEQITNYKLPSLIQGSPRLHKSQLQNLLIMVEEFRLPHFFKTLIVHEMTSS